MSVTVRKGSATYTFETAAKFSISEGNLYVSTEGADPSDIAVYASGSWESVYTDVPSIKPPKVVVSH